MQDKEYYNKGGLWAFLFSMAFSLSFFIYIAFVHPGVVLHEASKEGEAIEQRVADQPGEEAADKAVDVTSIEDPWNSSDALVAHGESLYMTNCKVCHGAKGLGDGPAGAALNPKPRDLVEGDWTKGGTSIALFKTLTDGIEGTSMAGFSHLSKVDRWALVHFIRDITENKVEDDQEKLKEFAQSAE